MAFLPFLAFLVGAKVLIAQSVIIYSYQYCYRKQMVTSHLLTDKKTAANSTFWVMQTF